jgi:hypothetical protein
VHFHFTPHVPQVPPISSSLFSLLFKSTNHDALHYGIIPSLLSLSLFDPKVSSSALCSQTYSPHIPLSVFLIWFIEHAPLLKAVLHAVIQTMYIFLIVCYSRLLSTLYR